MSLNNSSAEKTNWKHMLLNQSTLLKTAAVAGAGLQALGMFNLSFAAHNLIANQISAFFLSAVNTVTGNFLSAAAAGVISQVLAVVAIAAAVTALAYACVRAYNHFTGAKTPAVDANKAESEAGPGTVPQAGGNH
jgi:hypothetical protein